jgi:hypothetical protein
MREVRQVGDVSHQTLHARFERLARVGAALLQATIDLACNLGQHPDQMRDVAARVVDVGLQQHRVARGLVDLDAVLVCEDALELRAVEAGSAADQRHTGRIEAELIVLQAFQCGSPVRVGRQVVDKTGLPILHRHHGVGAEDTEVFRDQRIAVDRLTDREGDFHGIGHQTIAFKLHLASCHVEAPDELLVGTGRGVGEDRLLELLLDGVEFDVLDEEHGALAQRGHRLVGRVGLVDTQPDLARVGNQPGLE